MSRRLDSAFVVSLDEDDIARALELEGCKADYIEQRVGDLDNNELSMIAGELYDRLFSDIYTSPEWNIALANILNDGAREAQQ